MACNGAIQLLPLSMFKIAPYREDMVYGQVDSCQPALNGILNIYYLNIYIIRELKIGEIL